MIIPRQLKSVIGSTSIVLMLSINRGTAFCGV